MVYLKISKCQKVDLKMSKNVKNDEKLEIKCHKCPKVEHFENQTTPILIRYDLGPKKWIFGFIFSENNDSHCVYIDFVFCPFWDNFQAFRGSPYCIWRTQKIKIRPPNPKSRNDYSQTGMLPQRLFTKSQIPQRLFTKSDPRADYAPLISSGLRNSQLSLHNLHRPKDFIQIHHSIASIPYLKF